MSEKPLRRVNVIVYANYGEPNARIIHGHDHDFEDRRTQEHNRYIQQRIQDLSSEARTLIEEKEQRLVMRVKAAIREYYYTKSEAAKREFEEANSAYPFLFSRAWKELKEERARTAAPTPPPPEPEVASLRPAAPPSDVEPLEVVYPMEPELREQVLEIERLMNDLARDLEELRTRGSADDILVATCKKLVARAQESVHVRAGSEFNARRLETTRNALATTWRQVRSRLR